MSGFWNKVKAFFTAEEPGSQLSLHVRVQERMQARAKAGRTFGPADIAREITQDKRATHQGEFNRICELVELEFQQGLLKSFNYERTWSQSGGQPSWVFHPAQEAPPPPPPTSAAPPAASARMGVAPPVDVKPPPPNPYDAGGILGLSPEEMRKRALRVNPYQTAFIGRVDLIPPQSDERTALIDRGLILRGLLTEKELEEIHRVGDAWLRHKDAVAFAEVTAKKTADQAVVLLREQRIKAREEKRRVAREKREERARSVARRRAEDIIFLGAGVSRGLADRRSNIEQLQASGLPLLSTPADVAKALEVSVPRLRWLCFHAEAAERTHYIHFTVKKRSGGTRQLSAPHTQLAKTQQWILHTILEKLPVEAQAHGFIKGRSTLTNATAHVGSGLVINLDLSDFFPSVTFPRVRGVFTRMGYSPAVATVLALLCTESPRREVTYDGKTYQVAVGPRALPQGACTSPMLSNLVVRKLDRRLNGRAGKLGFTYTRYADDLTFSAKDGDANVGLMLAAARHIITDEGFRVNPDKGRVQHASGRQLVTGIVVNDRPSVPREEVRRLRAILHGARKTGLAAQNREGRENFRAWLQGKIAYLSMVDPERGKKFRAELDALSDAAP